jgi:pyridoxal phosphate enzyme (YggS family)
MDLAANLEAVRGRVENACRRAERAPSSVLLLPVSKGHPPDAVNEISRLGLKIIAENKVQEAKAKIPLCSGNIRWHMVGHLQTNKCRDAVALFDMIQSVDSIHLAEEIQKRAEQAAREMPILLEVNLAGEASKFGYRPDQVLKEVPEINRLARLEIQGLMTVPPWGPSPEKVRPYFQRLRELKQECEQILGAPLPHLSMGMSSDFEIAIEEGATIIRVGTALFGERAKK